MTKSQNTKNEQLTEQWKKGELPSGEYYIIDDLGLHTTDKYYPSHGFGTELPQSVLGRVPSYDEWEQLQNWADFTNDYHELREKLEIAEYKNAQLKELLKECKEMLQKSITYQCMDRSNHYIKKIENDIYEPTLAKINEVLR